MEMAKIRWLNYGVAMLAVALIGTSLSATRNAKVIAAAATPTDIRTVVPVHGSFADGSGWDAVATILASHVAYMSHPKEAAQLIAEAAASAHAN